MALADLLSGLDGKAELTAEDALAARREVFGGDARVSAEEAAALMRLNAGAGTMSPQWRAFFVEAMTDYVVRQTEPEGYVDEATARWLVDVIQHERRVRDDEVEMLVHILEAADQTPAGFSGFVLGMLKSLCLTHIEREGRLRPADIERLRRAVFAKGGASNLVVTRREAEALFDINDALGGMVADPVWTDFFVRAVGDAVLAEATWTPDAQGETLRSAWEADTAHALRETPGYGDPVSASASMRQILREAFRGDMLEHEMQIAVDRDDAIEARAEEVTADEAHWLMARIRGNGRIDANEQALLAFLRQEAWRIDPALEDAGEGLERQSPPHDAEASFASPVFGRRRPAA